MRAYFKGITRDGAGNIIPSATVSVYEAGGTTAASIYTTLAGATAVNSVTSGTDGSFEFYISRFDYNRDTQFKMVISKTGYSTITWDYVSINNIVLTTYTISTDTVVSTNLGYIPEGVLYSVASGKTLTISGSCDAGLYQIFSGTGSVVFSGSSTAENVYTEWYGAKADNSTDCTNALTAAWGAGLPIRLCNGVYRFTGPLNCSTNYFRLSGIGREKSTLLNIGTGGEDALTFNADYIQISDVTITGNLSSGNGISFNDSSVGYTGKVIDISNARVISHGGHGITWIGGEGRYCSYVNINNCQIGDNAYNAIYADENQTVNTITIIGSNIHGKTATYVANQSKGIHLEKFQTLTVLGNQFQTFYSGVQGSTSATGSGYGLVLHGNYFETFTEAGIDLGGTNYVSGIDVSGNYLNCNGITNATTGAGIRINKGFGNIGHNTFSDHSSNKKPIITTTGCVSLSGMYSVDIDLCVIGQYTNVQYVGREQTKILSGLHLDNWEADVNRSTNLYAEASTTYYFMLPVQSYNSIYAIRFFLYTDNADASATWTLYKQLYTGGVSTVATGSKTGNGVSDNTINVRAETGYAYMLKIIVASDGAGGSYVYLYAPNLVGNF